MICSFKLINFKKFEDQLIAFKPLTLISGLNSTGKSSILQSLLLLRQSFQQNLLPSIGLALNGELVNIGTAQDAARKSYYWLCRSSSSYSKLSNISIFWLHISMNQAIVTYNLIY